MALSAFAFPFRQQFQVFSEIWVQKLAPWCVNVWREGRRLGLLDSELLSLHLLLLLLEPRHIHPLEVLNENLLELVGAGHHQLDVIYDLWEWVKNIVTYSASDDHELWQVCSTLCRAFETSHWEPLQGLDAGRKSILLRSLSPIAIFLLFFVIPVSPHEVLLS